MNVIFQLEEDQEDALVPSAAIAGSAVSSSASTRRVMLSCYWSY